MTKKTLIIMGIVALCITFIILDTRSMDKKIDNFCIESTLDMKACYCMVNFLRYNSSKEVRNDFMKAIRKGDKLYMYPRLILPAIGASIKCENYLQ